MGQHPALGHAMLATAVLLWGGNAVIARAASGLDVPPMALNFWRWSVSFLVFLPFGLSDILRNVAIYRANWPYFFLYGFVSVCGFNTFFYIALQYTTAIQGTLIQSLLPAVTLLGAWVVFRQGMTGRQIAGIAVTVPGAALVVLRGDIDRLIGLAFNLGDLLMLGSVACWATQILILRFMPKGVGLAGFQTAAIFCGLTFNAALYAGEMAIGGAYMPVNPTSVFFVLYAGVMGGVIGMTLWNVGTFRVGGQSAGYFGNLYPVFTALLAIPILGEELYWYHLVGGALVLSGITLATSGPRRAPAPAAAAP
jgi:drug/metabolite transporter (DMT)-like permease